MNDDPNSLRREIERAAEDLQSKKRRLELLENSCLHEWGPVRYESVVTMPAHYYGDEPGTMGVDYIPKRWVPEQRRDQWTRTCKKCGKTQRTSQTTKEVKEVPKF